MTIGVPQDCLDRWKYLFLQQLEQHCMIYSLIGRTTDESPMWFQYRSMEWSKVEDGTNCFCLMFASSQRKEIYFAIPLEDEEWDFVPFKASMFNDLYDFFREAKYDYIKSFHPRIYSQLK